MNILIVAVDKGGHFAPFVEEQAEALRQCMVYGVLCTVEYFGVTGKGVTGYLKQLPLLKAKIRAFQPDVVHAHYSLCGLLSCITVKSIIPSFRQSIIPPKLVTTYHGSDINNPKVLLLSKIAMRLSAWNVFISKKTMNIALGNQQSSIINHQSSIAHKSALIPCGINMPPEEGDPRITNALLSVSKVLEPGKKHVLFAGAFSNAVKDPDLAKSVITIINERLMAQLTEINVSSPVQLIELNGYNRDQVTALMYACDAFLMTSKSEGSPQVIKEAMACGLPIVSVDVGDVKERFTVSMENGKCNMENGLLEGCYVAKSRNPEEVAELLGKALAYGKRTEGRQRIEEMGLRNEQIAQKLVEIYKSVSCSG